MINKPSVEELEKDIPVRFVIANAIAKRSRDIASGAKVRIDTKENNPLTIAAMELKSGQVRVVEAAEQEDELLEDIELEETVEITQ